jgi:hypothetical protein
MDVATSTGQRPRIMEWQISLGAATASRYGLYRTSALGTRTSPVALLPEDPADPALTGIRLVDAAFAFSAEPTEAANALRSIAFPATISSNITWIFPRGLILAVSLSLAIVNQAANANALDGYVAADV